MSKLIWVIVWLGVTVWSGLCWLTYQAVGLAGGFVARNADGVAGDPEVVEQFSSIALKSVELGEWVVIASWALGCVIAFALGWIASKLLARVNRQDVILANPPAPPAP
jgi:hypothetical protein